VAKFYAHGKSGSVQTCVDDRKLHGKARYFDRRRRGSWQNPLDGGTLAPATLIWQWQEELEDKARYPGGRLVNPKEMLIRTGLSSRSDSTSAAWPLGEDRIWSNVTGGIGDHLFASMPAARRQAKPVDMIPIRQGHFATNRGLEWEYTERVLSSRDLDEWMRQGW
jgi:hypothetical protein